MNLLKLAEEIRDSKASPWIYIASTGAGARIASILWDAPGASSILAGSSFPYATHEMDNFIGFQPDKYCSSDAALAMAMSSYMRACVSRPAGRMAVGLGMSTSVASVEQHRGDHRIHATILSDMGALSMLLTIPKGKGVEQRVTDGSLSDTVGIELIRQILGMPALPISANRIGEFGGNFQASGDGIIILPKESDESFLREHFFRRPLFTPFGSRLPSYELDVGNVVFLPGSFDPLHEGHRAMADAIERRTGKRAVYCITADSVHKPSLTTATMLNRAANIMRGIDRTRDLLYTEHQPLFIDKARKYPNVAFAIGADTMKRMLDPKWGPPIEPLLREFRGLGARFYVFSRKSGDHTDHVADILRTIFGEYDPWMAEIFEEMPDRLPDISSSQIRAAS